MTLLEALRQIKSNPIEEYGICGNLEVHLQLDNKLEGLFKAWPDCHQLFGMPDIGFPVSGHRKYREEVNNKTLWQNPKRIALLDWCIQTLEKENENF